MAPTTMSSSVNHTLDGKSSTYTKFYNLGQKSVERVAPIVLAAQSYAMTAIMFLKAFLDKYPPVKAFVYTLAGTSAIPLAVFIGWSAVVLGICLAIAGYRCCVRPGWFHGLWRVRPLLVPRWSFHLHRHRLLLVHSCYFAYKVAQTIDRSSNKS
ncbi:hypothetical protein BC829DRAFT_184319 [Chytridium lagenaria]|nr:hypothetical protein BC829DRAFT_184319 [Chytridium lagenaria]